MDCLKLLLWLGILIDAAGAQDFQCPKNESLQSSDPWALFRQAFPSVGVSEPTGNPLLGNQNYTYCCLLALNEYLNNGCSDSSNVWVRGLESNSQFPCGAQWNGNSAGAPLVKVSYWWSATRCPGWQKSSATNLNQWLQMLVGFLFPAVVFCLNIPRRRKIKVWDQLFPENIDNYRLITAAFSATMALLIVIVDTVMWLFTVFAIAAPLLLSGLYEARLDKRVVSFIDAKEKSKRLPIALRARMLFTILCGNLDLYLAWSDIVYLAKALDQFDINSTNVATAEPVPTGIFTEPYVSSPSMNLGGETCMKAIGSLRESDVTPNDNSSEHNLESQRGHMVAKVSSRLKAMLACQYSFGSVVGAPVLFYIGSFVYSILQVRQTYGNTDVAYALSFGMWWMVIPHIAIISGFLLGGNNPNTLEGIIGNEPSDCHIGGPNTVSVAERRQSSTETYERMKEAQGLYSKIFGRVYEAAYKPASMWNRGRSKQSWLLALYADSMFRYKDQGKVFNDDVQPSMEQFLNDTIMFGPLDWIYLGLAAIALVFIPCAFGFCLSYFTPQIGLACRSLTLLLYACAQTLLTIVWIIRTTWRDEFWCQGQRVRHALAAKKTSSASLWTEVERLKCIAETCIEGLPHRSINGGTYTATRFDATTWLEKQCQAHDLTNKWPRIFDWIYYSSSVVGFGVSIFTAIGGTLLQIMGVYRNNICKMTVVHWLPGHRAGAGLQLSTNSAEAIAQAKGTWTNLGSLSVAFLIICCYIGWWYQKRLRRHFMLVASKLDPQM